MNIFGPIFAFHIEIFFFSGDCFGVRYFGQNWGWAQPGYAIVGWILQALLGYFYDHQIDLQYSTTCYGRKCFTVILIIAALLCFMAVIMNIAFYVRQRNRIRNGNGHVPVVGDTREMDVAAVSHPEASAGRFSNKRDYRTLSDDNDETE